MGTSGTGAFQRFAGACAIAAGVLGLLYSFGFVVLSNVSGTKDFGGFLYSLCALLGGLATTAVMAGLYMALRGEDEAFALWAFLLGMGSALGTAIHGGYDLANVLNAPTSDPLSAANLPNQVDPRGLVTFGIASVALFTFSWLIRRSPAFPKNLGYLGYALSAGLVILYVARLTILSATNLVIVVPALLTGFLLNPAWYLWVGSILMRRSQAAAETRSTVGANAAGV